MNTQSKGRTPGVASRVFRGIGAAAISTVLIVGLAGCMTGKTTISGPVVVHRNAEVPAGVDLSQPADRIEEQLARRTDTVHMGSWTDRIAAQIEYEAGHGAARNPYPGRVADRIEEELARDAAAQPNAFRSVPRFVQQPQ
jgi:hypothetical protein